MKNALIAAVVAAVVAAAGGTAATIVVTSKNIKNGTIQTIDISAKAKAALKGNRGRRGARGATGAQGPQGPPGPAGPNGITNAYSMDFTFVQTSVPDSGGAIARINLPAGKFIVFASASFRNPAATDALLQCRIADGVPGPSAGFRYAMLEGTGGDPSALFANATIELHAIVLPDTPRSFDLYCSDNGGQITLSSVPFPNLTAVEFNNAVSM
jgi:hypothetical protein